MRGSVSAALRCERRLAILERSETAKRCESLLNALYVRITWLCISRSTEMESGHHQSQLCFDYELYSLYL